VGSLKIGLTTLGKNLNGVNPLVKTRPKKCGTPEKAQKVPPGIPIPKNTLGPTNFNPNN